MATDLAIALVNDEHKSTQKLFLIAENTAFLAVASLIAPCLLVPTSEQRPPLSRGGAVRGATAEGSWVATCTLGFTAEKVRDEHGVDVSVLHAIKGNPDG